MPSPVPNARLVPASAPAVARLSLKGRLALLAVSVVVQVALGSWLFFEVNQFYRQAVSGEDQALAQELAFGRWIMLAGVGAGSLVTVFLVSGVFRLLQTNWRAQAKMLCEGAEKEARAVTERLRLVAADRTAAWDTLNRVRHQLEADVKARDNEIRSLSFTKQQLEEELDRRRRAEQTMARQSQTLAASKDVLQIHVQNRSEELQKLQKQHEMILNAADEGICGVNASGRISFVNPTAARLLGLEVDKMVGKKEEEIFGPAQPGETSIFAKQTAGKQNEVVLTRTDHSTFTAEFMRSHIIENERVVGRVVLFKDITERKQAAQALEQKAEELARSNAELEQFAFVASHDLQEPLRKIRAFGDRLKLKCDGALPAEGADYLARMLNAAARMQTLIADLLTFSRVISRFEPFVEVDLKRIVQEVLGDLEVRIEKAGATVTVGELPTIEADPTQFRQVFQNLIGNALKFQKPEVKPLVEVSGRILPAEDENSELGDRCEIQVRDNGIGFDEKYLDRIFAVFQRLHNRQEYEGTGIGLAVCRRIVERHQGTITARSKPDEGATFIVQVPVRPPRKK
jgi:PAS domain S-box-containing protein